ncbi:MAG: hypothetical protein V4664_02350 [Patescibacteria group bacterium]
MRKIRVGKLARIELFDDEAWVNLTPVAAFDITTDCPSPRAKNYQAVCLMYKMLSGKFKVALLQTFKGWDYFGLRAEQSMDDLRSCPDGHFDPRGNRIVYHFDELASTWGFARSALINLLDQAALKV